MTGGRATTSADLTPRWINSHRLNLQQAGEMEN